MGRWLGCKEGQHPSLGASETPRLHLSLHCHFSLIESHSVHPSLAAEVKGWLTGASGQETKDEEGSRADAGGKQG